MLLTLLRLLSVFLIVMVTSPASAGTINVLGSVDIRNGISGDAVLNLGGDRGFTLNGFAQFFSNGPDVNPGIACMGLANQLCSPGATISLGARSNGSDVGARATFEGVSYPFVGGVGCGTSPETCGNLSIFFAGQTVVPPLGDFTKAILKEPVLFSATFFHFEGSGFGSNEQLVASAIATLTLDKVELENVPLEFAGPAWRFGGIEYELEPVPEPATLLLWGTAVGLGLLARRRRK